MLNASNSDKSQIIEARWLSENMILMLDGEWLVYRSHCNEEPPHLVQDIFLAKGSNDKWYYSSGHFCVRMCALVMMQEEQPPDLETFARIYNLKEFDGKSDECLLPTQSFPDTNRETARQFTSDIKPGPPDMAPILRAAKTAGMIAQREDPDLKGHDLDLSVIRYSHRFRQPQTVQDISYTGVYCDNALRGGNATGINFEVRDNVAYFKTQRGLPLWSCTLDGRPKVPENALVLVAQDAITNFWPKIKLNRLSLDEIVCCDPLNGSKYSVNFRLAGPQVRETPPKTFTLFEVPVGADGTVKEDEVHWEAH